MSLDLPYSLIQDIRNHKVCLFFGAGASKEANFPTANELAEYIIGKTGKDFAEKLRGQTLDFVADYLYTKPGYGKAWVREQVIDYFVNAHKHLPHPLSRAHHQMTRIGWRRLFTTNYDRLVEISYERSDARVQELFSVYDVSNNIDRREDAIVQLIKLNGSYDKALYDEYHELVLTFGEQRDAFTQNQKFYEILRTEATYGPIIFIGFRFAHPGAKGASSPEFETLKNLLRDIGSGRWHYCVTPYDENDISAELAVSQLAAINVSTINATFGEFMNSLAEAIDNGIALNTRPPIIVPVGKRQLVIPAETFDLDQRHFQMLGTYIDTISAPEVAESLNGQANWGTFVQETLIERHCTAAFRHELQIAFRDAPQFVVLDAPPGWGKSFFLRDLSVRFYKGGTPVIWLNPYGTIELTTTQPIVIGSWDVTRIRAVLSEIKSLFDQQNVDPINAVPIIIADDCPERVDELISMYNALRDSGERFVLILSLRDSELQFVKLKQPLIRRNAHIFHATVNEDIQIQRKEIDSLIEFCRQHNVGAIRGQGEADLIVRRIFEEQAQVLLILALFIIFDREHRPFSKIVKDFWDELSSETSKLLVLRTAALHRFGSRFSPRLYTLTKTFPRHENSPVLDLYRREIERGRGFLYEYEEEGEPCVRTLHSLVAQRITQSDICEKTPIEVDDELVAIVSNMSSSGRDLEMLRALLKNITEYKVNLSSDEKTEELFRTISRVTNDDWVVCHQFANYLLSQGLFERASSWIGRAIDSNPDHTPLIHTKGNIYYRWGKYYRESRNLVEAEALFKEASTYFSMSRIRREPDEYGYVTDLDMTIYRMQNVDEDENVNLQAYGVQLFREAMRTIPPERINYLLKDVRFRQKFDLQGKSITNLCSRIRELLNQGKASEHAVVFLAQTLYEKGDFTGAISALRQYLKYEPGSAVIYIKEAELYTKEGLLTEASSSIASAFRLKESISTAETGWALLYWNLVICLAQENYKAAREASFELSKSGYYSRLFVGQQFPRGYIWKDGAKTVDQKLRTFQTHAKVYRGKIERIRAGEAYGQIAMRDYSGEIFLIDFMPRYFKRTDLRQGDNISFVITLLPSRVRADDVESTPFVNIVDNIYIR